MRKIVIINIILLWVPLIASGQADKDYKAQHTNEAPVIDGDIEGLWFQAPRGDDFKMYEPYDNKEASFPTRFYGLYDDQALYMACIMIDPHPNTIRNELGQRDKFDALDADHISIDFLPFNDGLNGYAFKVTPANLQADEKYSAGGADQNWDAVWKSATAITDSGWIAEFKIPWSTLRFPEKEEQVWGFTVWRNIRRYREWDTWNRIDKSNNNVFAEYAQLSNIKNVEPPLRLSVMPYFSAYANMHKNKTDFPYNGGMDVKYGINESFTLDMTLIPDFGQVFSDDVVLNLSPYEVQYDEKRQFFTEGTELFSKGNIFYSRRIGNEPEGYNEVNEKLDSGEVIKENPEKIQLINATKISGRTPEGMGIGIFNAMTSNTYATIENAEGEERKLRTQPFTNYNMLVLDQNLPNNGYLSLVNTNVSRFANHYSANVSGTDFSLRNNKQTYSLSGMGLISQKYKKGEKPLLGHKYKLELSREKGNFQFEIERKVLSKTFDPNDMGYLAKNNYVANKLELEHKILNPRGIILGWTNSLETAYNELYEPSRYSEIYVSLNSRGTFKNHLTVSFNGTYYPKERHDFHEARVRYTPFNRPPSWNCGFWISSDYRKELAVDAGGNYEQTKQWKAQMMSFRLKPRFRISDQLFFTAGTKIKRSLNGRGFVNYRHPEIIFGKRNTRTVENTITGRYIFSTKHGINLRIRHYWAKVNYQKYYTLIDDGNLTFTDVSHNYDINFNAFNIDLAYNWRFAPGSEMSIVWKNELLKQTNQTYKYYRQSLEQIFHTPQYNSLSVKLLYYLDYDTVKKIIK